MARPERAASARQAREIPSAAPRRGFRAHGCGQVKADERAESESDDRVVARGPTDVVGQCLLELRDPNIANG